MTEIFDLSIRNATIVDGTGSARYRGNLAVRGDRIVRMDTESLPAKKEIDANGLVLAPGFIDAHTHDDRLMLSDPAMAPKVSQGVTTVIAGNCGISLAPMPRRPAGAVTPPLDLLDDEGGWFRYRSFGAYVGALQANPPATNCGLLVGLTTLRVTTMDCVDRPATGAEIARMRELLIEAMRAGAIGASTGLYYEPAVAATMEEVIEVCRPLRELGGLYCTHMRNEADKVIDSLEESFRTAREVGVPVVISHHKVTGIANHGRSPETLACIGAHQHEQAIGLDCYPYSASSTILSADRAAVAMRTLVTWSKPLPQYAGQDLRDVAKKMGVTEEEAVQRLLPAGAIYFSMDEADVQRILAFEPTMVGSDGLPHDAFPHPRLWSTFPRVLGHYSRDLGLFSLETAVHKMTGLTAKTFELEGRGVLREGAYADLVLFDPETVAEAANFENPIAPAHGIKTVIVNGAMVWNEGRSTGNRPGRVLRRTAPST
ncbi:MAG: N-acyl-D-amino-acid deacylase family protein [Burkholderiales bacterium]